MKPNVIIFNPDQMRADCLRHLGNEAAYTPNLDALTDEGASFSQAFCQNPVCVPSRCSFMTGLYPHTRGHRTMAHLLHPDEDNLFLQMKKEGYYTVSSTRGDLLAGQEDAYHRRCVDEYIRVKARRGEKAALYKSTSELTKEDFSAFYDGIIPTKNADDVAVNMDDLTVNGAVRFLKKRPSNKPFFMFLALNYPHPPYEIEQKYFDLIRSENLPARKPAITDDSGKPAMETGLRDMLGVPQMTDAKIQELRTVYLAMCAKIDDLFGRLVEALKSEGIYDDTAILVFSDHGDYTTDFGLVEKVQNCFPDCLVNVPLLVKPPRGVTIERGVRDSLVELVDVPATCLEFAGREKPDYGFGKSLTPLLKERGAKLHDVVFCEGGRLDGEAQASECESLREGDRYYPRLSLQTQVPPHNKAVMARDSHYKYVRRLDESDEFYDLTEGESKNLIGDEKYAPEIARLQQAMLEWFQRTSDIVPEKLDDRFNSEFICNLIGARGFPRFVGVLFKGLLKLVGMSAGQFVSKVRKRFNV